MSGNTPAELIVRLPDEWEENAKSVRQIEADLDYSNYWRGYAVALEQCARVLRARAALTGEQG